MAKYPFVREAREFVGQHFDLNLAELPESENREAIERGFQRVYQAIKRKKVPFDTQNMIRYDTEVVSFPVAVVLVALINDDMLRNMYATAEAKRCSGLMSQDRTDIPRIADELEFHFRVAAEENEQNLLAIRLVDYLAFSPQLWGEKWRLVNRVVDRGEVLVADHEFARILEEKIKRSILERTRADVSGIKLPTLLVEKRTELADVWKEYKAAIQPEVHLEPRDIPPCMNRLMQRMTKGENLSHVERRTLVSYLAAIGWAEEEMMSLLRYSPDFNERIAKYQLEHITGRRGKGKKYSPPSCATMKMYGLCFPDKWCNHIRHPLKYRRTT
jgi:DNA primase large subunit